MEEFKTQLENKTNDLGELNEDFKAEEKDLNARYKHPEQSINSLQEEKNSLLEKNERLERINREYAEALFEQIQSLKDEIILIQNLNRENAEYQRKLSKITDTWYGKTALKAYHLLKKIKSIFC